MAPKLSEIPVPRFWNNSPSDVLGAYRAALALDSPNYALAPDTLKELVALLRSSRPQAGGVTIKGAPTVVFAAGPVRRPPRIVRRAGDTFARPASATSARP